MKSFTVNGSVVVTIQPREKNSYLCVNSDGNLTVEVIYAWLNTQMWTDKRRYYIRFFVRRFSLTIKASKHKHEQHS